jgi:hypothetical protein
MAAVQVSAAQAVGEYVQLPEDLVKIPGFEKNSRRRKHLLTHGSRQV